MTIDVLQKALRSELLIPEFSNGVLDLSQAEYILKASKKEFETFLKFLAKPEIYNKITAIIVNITPDEKNRFLKIIHTCKSLTNVKITSLNYGWSPKRLTTLVLMRGILKNPHLKTLELEKCETHSSMRGYIPRVADFLARHFETIIISDLVIADLNGAHNFVSFIQAYGETKLKHLVLKNITFDFWDYKGQCNDAKNHEFIHYLKKQLHNLKNDCSTLQTLTIENIQGPGTLSLDKEYCQSLNDAEPEILKVEKSLQIVVESYNALMMIEVAQCEKLIKTAFDNSKPFNDYSRRKDYKECVDAYSQLKYKATALVAKCKAVEQRMANSFFSKEKITPRKGLEMKLSELHEQIFGGASISLKQLMNDPSQRATQQEIDNEELNFLF